MTAGVVDVMREVFTPPYSRGLELMPLTFGAVGPQGEIQINNYDFQAYATRYGRLPDSPRYVLVPWFYPDSDLDLTFAFTHGGHTDQVSIQLLAGSERGVSLAVPIPIAIDPRLVNT